VPELFIDQIVDLSKYSFLVTNLKRDENLPLRPAR